MTNPAFSFAPPSRRNAATEAMRPAGAAGRAWTGLAA